MEKNYINWPGKTHFYIDIENKTYGVMINSNETRSADKIINEALKKYKNSINSWKKEWQTEEGVV